MSNRKFLFGNWNFFRSALTPESVTKETHQVLEEVARALNLEKLLPTYKFAVTVGCLKTIRKLQKCGQLPSKSDLFKSYAQYGQFHGRYFNLVDGWTLYGDFEFCRCSCGSP